MQDNPSFSKYGDIYYIIRNSRGAIMEREEFTRITDLYIDDIKRLAYSGCKNEQDAEDITQEVFIKLLKCENVFESDAHVKNWLIRVTINQCNSLWRTPWKKRVVLSMPKEPQMLYSEKENDLMSNIRSLTSKYREIIHLFYYEEMSVRQIAETLRISEGDVKTRLHRARKKLEKMMKK